MGIDKFSVYDEFNNELGLLIPKKVKYLDIDLELGKLIHDRNRSLFNYTINAYYKLFNAYYKVLSDLSLEETIDLLLLYDIPLFRSYSKKNDSKNEKTNLSDLSDDYLEKLDLKSFDTVILPKSLAMLSNELTIKSLRYFDFDGDFYVDDTDLSDLKLSRFFVNHYVIGYSGLPSDDLRSLSIILGRVLNPKDVNVFINRFSNDDYSLSKFFVINIYLGIPKKFFYYYKASNSIETISSRLIISKK